MHQAANSNDADSLVSLHDALDRTIYDLDDRRHTLERLTFGAPGATGDHYDMDQLCGVWVSIKRLNKERAGVERAIARRCRNVERPEQTAAILD